MSASLQQYPQSINSGTIDSSVATINGNDYLYVLAANASAIDVFSLKAPGQAQNIQTVQIGGSDKIKTIDISKTIILYSG